MRSYLWLQKVGQCLPEVSGLGTGERRDRQGPHLNLNSCQNTVSGKAVDHFRDGNVRPRHPSSILSFPFWLAGTHDNPLFKM